MRTVALIALLVIIGVAQCGLIRRSKVEKSNFFDDISNAFGNLFGRPATNTWNSQGVHFNVSNSSNSSNTTNTTWNSNGYRFEEETAAAPATETPVAETPAPVAEKPKKKGLKQRGKKFWNSQKWKSSNKNKKTKNTEKAEQSDFFDDIANAFGNLFGRPATNTWNSQGVHFNVSNSSNSSNNTNTTWNSKGYRFEETVAAAPATEAPVAETPAPVAEKPKKKERKHRGNRIRISKPWKKNAKKVQKTETEQSDFFDDISMAFSSLFGKPTNNTWNSQGVHFNVSNSSNSSNTTNTTWNSNGYRFEEETAAAAPATEAPVAETPAPVAEKPKKKGRKHRNNKLRNSKSWKKNAKKAPKTETEQSNFFDDISNAFGSLFGKPTNTWNSQGVHFNVSNSSNSSNTTNTTWNSNGWRFEEETVAAPKKRGFLGKVGGFFKGLWGRVSGKKRQTETTDESDMITGNWNSAGVTFPQQQTTWNSQGVTYPQPQNTWNSQGVTFPQPQNTWNPVGYTFPQPQRAWNNQGYRY